MVYGKLKLWDVCHNTHTIMQTYTKYNGTNHNIQVSNICRSSYPCWHAIIVTANDGSGVAKLGMRGDEVLQLMRQHGVQDIPQHFLDYDREMNNDCDML